MERRKLGHTDLEVSRIGFGCEALGGTDWGRVDQGAVSDAVARALDVGVNLFDTADVYGLGRSEELLSKALGSRRHDVVIATKFGVRWRKGLHDTRARTWFDSSPRRVVAALEASLRRLKLERIPLYLVHWPDPNTPVEKTLEALRKCRDMGRVDAVGVSNFPVNAIQKAHSVVPLSAVEVPYSLLDRRVESGILTCCQNLGISVLAYGTLAQGLVTGKYGLNSRFASDDRRSRLAHFRKEERARYLRCVHRVLQVAAGRGRTPAQTAIRWVLDSPAVSTAIAGVKSVTQVEENVGATGWKLSAEEYRFLAEWSDEPAHPGATVDNEAPPRS